MRGDTMRVEQLMTRDVKTCVAHDTLSTAAKIMWDHDCGCVPVVDDEGRVVGMLTDRDISMATYTQNARPSSIRVSSAMSKEVHACRPEDSLVVAQKVLRVNKVRRLPVVAGDGRLVGIVSLNDIALEAAREHMPPTRDVSAESLTETMAVICEHRLPRGAAAA